MLTQIAPNPLLPHLTTLLPGPKAAAIIARDRAVISPSYTRQYPLVIQRGEGAVVEDVDGNRFLDFAAGIAVVATGHSHPRVVSAIQKQAAEFLHMSGTDFYYESMVELAEKLARLTPGNVARRVYFGNSGTEAIEAAIKLARYHTGRDKFIAFLGGFHGRTMGALSLTASRVTQRRGFHPPLPVHHIPYANCYRCPYGKQPETCAVECVTVLEDQLFKTVLPPEEVAAIVVEPIQGEGGYLVPPAKFHQELRRIADRYGILLIHDEVQSGIARTGAWFACEHEGIVPDLITTAKGLAGGMPLAAVTGRADVMDAAHAGGIGGTYSGNPVACAAALGVFEEIETGQLISRARATGQEMTQQLRTIAATTDIVGEIRGRGAMIAVELVQPGTREPHRDAVAALARHCHNNGVLTLTAGTFGNVLRFLPPLTISDELLAEAFEVLRDGFAKL